MFIIDWVFDKMGYTKKVYWADVFKNWQNDCPKPVKKVATKRKSPAKKSLVKTVRKKA
jgi:hypothetical protein